MVKMDKEVYRAEMSERLARLEEKHEAHMEMTREIKVMLQMQNGRVRELEKKQSWIMGGVGVITFVFGSLIAWLKGDI